MTTVACSLPEGAMASDTMFRDDVDGGHMRKIWKFRGVVYGIAGNIMHLPDVKEWVKGDRKPPAGDWSLLAMSNKLIRTYDPVNGWIDIDEKVYAIGSGQAAARGAMLAGASLRQAVRLAIHVDPESGGKVRVISLPKT